MNHFSIVRTSDADTLLEFSHFDYDAPEGLWTKENVIVRGCIKINVFVEGSFSVFSDGLLHQPIYGDICFLPPMKMHYGQIKEPMHIDYYQIDIGRGALSMIPDGDVLLGRLLDITSRNDSFLRPDAKNRERVLRLCQETEAAIQREECFLAYAKVVELLSLLYHLYLRPTGVASVSFSLRTAQAIRYIEKNFSEDVSVNRLSEELGISNSFLSRIFKKEIGMSVHEYLNRYRILKSVELLQTHSVTETGYLCGFCDNSHFISVFKRLMGTTPMRYKSSQGKNR